MVQARSLSPVDLPDGKYTATQVARVLRIQLPGWEKIRINIDNGIHGIRTNVPVVIKQRQLMLVA